MKAMLTGDEASQFFEAQRILYPNLGLDLFAGLIGTIVPPALTLTLFVCLALGAFIYAAIWWRSRRGEKTDLALVLIILLAAYSEPLYWGLFNYILGLGVMFVALHRAIEQQKAYSGNFVITQAMLVGAMCLISIFPVMLYVSFCLGMLLVAIADGKREGRFTDLANLMRSHWLSASVVVVLLLVMEPGQSGETQWHLATKLTGIFSIGKTTNLSFEYLLSALVLGAAAWLAWLRGMRMSRHEAAGLLACCLLFAVMPKNLMSVGAADRRLVPAIVTIAVIFVGGPSAQTAKPTRFATSLLSAVVALKLALLVYLWAPLKELDATYAEIAKAIPPDAIVLFVPPVNDHRPNAVERARRFTSLAAQLQPVPAAEAHVFVQHPHLLLKSLAGRHVLPTQAFSNFWAKKKPEFRDLPDPAPSETYADVATALARLPPGVVSYVISHIDLDGFFPPGASARRMAEVGGVQLYLATRVGETLPRQPGEGQLVQHGSEPTCWSSVRPHWAVKDLCPYRPYPDPRHGASLQPSP